MYCPNCGKELPTGAATCPSCHARVIPPPPRATHSDPIDQAADDLKRAAEEFVATTTRLSKELSGKVEAAAKEPSESARKAVRRVSEELDRVAKEIDKALKEL
jgi:hypothetical protein